MAEGLHWWHDMGKNPSINFVKKCSLWGQMIGSHRNGLTYFLAYMFLYIIDIS